MSDGGDFGGGDHLGGAFDHAPYHSPIPHYTPPESLPHDPGTFFDFSHLPPDHPLHPHSHGVPNRPVLHVDTQWDDFLLWHHQETQRRQQEKLFRDEESRRRSTYSYDYDTYPAEKTPVVHETPSKAQKAASISERIGAMSGWQKVGAVAGVAAVLDGVRRIFAHRPSSLKEDASPEEKKNAVNQQLLGAVEGAGGGLWTAKILEDAGKAAIRRL